MTSATYQLARCSHAVLILFYISLFLLRPSLRPPVSPPAMELRSSTTASRGSAVFEFQVAGNQNSIKEFIKMGEKFRHQAGVARYHGIFAAAENIGSANSGR